MVYFKSKIGIQNLDWRAKYSQYWEIIFYLCIYFVVIDKDRCRVKREGAINHQVVASEIPIAIA